MLEPDTSGQHWGRWVRLGERQKVHAKEVVAGCSHAFEHRILWVGCWFVNFPWSYKSVIDLLFLYMSIILLQGIEYVAQLCCKDMYLCE